ncbi:hypothetical protein [Flavobacterium psychrotrophum]|uniref:hypothetical protein n=1 Tax=Flavobacterium psychrotrophum TaxID=2294119 RepID=UPI000E311768|nr:hypothetical protein [Flavobacterium psychrotrophum]
MINKTALALLFLTVTGAIFGQSNNQTSSPYSLFGIGRFNEVNTGITNALGKSGIALSGENSINNLNPAAYADLPKNSFMFDIGIKGEQNSYTNNQDNNVNINTNFSNISLALAFSEKSGLGISLSPYSDVGYVLQGVTSTIEGSQDTYSSYITGSGGLNNIAANYGYKLTPKLNLGILGNYFFGKIAEQEELALEYDYLSVTENSYYSGVRFGIGMQYKFDKDFTVGSVINLPTTLSGTQDRDIKKIVNSVTTNETQASRDIAGFKLPLEVGAGIKYSYKSFTFNADYKHLFWNATGMEDNIGKFTDSDFFGIGAQYVNNKLRTSYFEKFQYRIGCNMDNGYLDVDGVRIKNLALTSGIGIPLGGRKSFLNISYSYGQRGVVSTRLLQEKYHAFTINICLEDLWFLKRKYE